MIRVLIVDDQDAVRAALRGILRERYGFAVVGECDNGSGVISAVDTTNPDVVVMDIRMPEVDGVAATAALGRHLSGPPVIMLTTFDDDQNLAAALRAGAAGFLLKGGPAEDLQQAVRVVAQGGAWLDPAVTGRVLHTYRSTTAAVDNARLDVLTARERQVLALIGQGQSNAEIATQFVVGEGTVKTHVNHIFAKLRLRDRAAAVVLAFDCGLVAPRPEPDRR